MTTTPRAKKIVPTEPPKKKVKLTLQGMLSRLALASEDGINLIVDTMNDPTAELKERLACAKYVLTQHASLLAQAERERLNVQTSAMNTIRLKQAQREEQANEGVQVGRYLGMGEVSMEIPVDE